MVGNPNAEAPRWSARLQGHNAYGLVATSEAGEQMVKRLSLTCPPLPPPTPSPPFPTWTPPILSLTPQPRHSYCTTQKKRKTMTTTTAATTKKEKKKKKKKKKTESGSVKRMLNPACLQLPAEQVPPTPFSPATQLTLSFTQPGTSPPLLVCLQRCRPCQSWHDGLSNTGTLTLFHSLSLTRRGERESSGGVGEGMEKKREREKKE